MPLSDGVAGLFGLTIAYAMILISRPPLLFAAWIVLMATAAPMLWLELRRTPQPAPRPGSAAGATSPWLWIAGFGLATAPFLLVHGQGMGLIPWLVAWAVAAPAFMLRFLLESRRNGTISAGFPGALGQVLARPRPSAFRALLPDARLWALKGFFIPLYGVSMFGLLHMTLAADLSTPLGLIALAVIFAYTIDLTFAFSGYLFANNELAPTVRSTQHRVLGWIVCLACYGPVIKYWPDFHHVVRQEITWPEMLAADPPVVAAGMAMLVLLCLYASATVAFGLRFANLSNRGVITSGPYRLMKHPAYFAHAANAWIICLVLMPAAGIDLGAAQWLVPVAFTILYRLRAITEEQHLNEDPDYRAYAAWIARHGLLARLRRLLRFG